MKLADAKPGDVLLDKDGDPWIMLPDDMAANIWETRKSGPTWPDVGLDDIAVRVEWVDTMYGPFTRLVPEALAPDAL